MEQQLRSEQISVRLLIFMFVIILSVLLIGLSVIIYYPFLKVYEASLDREEAMELEAVKAD